MKILIKYQIIKFFLNSLISLKYILKFFIKIDNFEKILNYIFLRVSYFDFENLKSDLESVNKISLLRTYFVGKNFKKKKIFVKKKKYKIGFLINVSKENLMSISHFLNVKSKYKIFIYDHVQNNIQKKNSQKYKLNNLKLINKYNITYKTINPYKYYLDSNNNQKNIAKMINNDDLDIFVFNTGVSDLKLIDEIDAGRIISINKTSIVVPHEKIDYQSFQQPPWPYRELKGKIYNFKYKKIINKKVSTNLFSYTKRNLKFKFKKNKNIILWYGNLKKLAEERFLKIISEILINFPQLELHFFGKYEVKYYNFIINHFESKKIKNYQYKGAFNFNNEKELDIKNLFKFKKSLEKTKIMINSLRMSGGRYAVEAYQFKIPIINYNLSDKEWLNNKEKLFYKIVNLFIDINAVRSEQEYLRLFKKIMNSNSFEQKIIKAQSLKFQKVTSGKEFWRNLEDLIKI